MAWTKEAALQHLHDIGVVAVIRAKSSDQLLDIANALLEGGASCIEVTMSTPNAVAGIASLRAKLGDKALLGVGTVLDDRTAHDAIAAGAEFVVSPAFDPLIVVATHEAGKVSIPGAFTATEILRAWNAGADIVKVFPSTAVGPGYFKDLLAPLPFLKLTPTGGVDLKNAADWIKAGAVCIGVGSALISKDALANNDWKAIAKSARAFVEAVRGARSKPQ